MYKMQQTVRWPDCTIAQNAIRQTPENHQGHTPTGRTTGTTPTGRTTGTLQEKEQHRNPQHPNSTTTRSHPE